MTASSVLPSFPTFNDVDGNPLESGFIYIGLPNLNPEVAPKQAFFDKEMTIPAPQPIRTIGGYPSRNGTPTQLYVDGDFSLTVRDKNGALIYNAATEAYRFSLSSVGPAIQPYPDRATAVTALPDLIPEITRVGWLDASGRAYFITRQSGAQAITDMMGWVPDGMVMPGHFGIVGDVRVPFHFPDLQAVFDVFGRERTENITIRIDSGHTITTSVFLEQGDWSAYDIVSDAPVVSVVLPLVEGNKQDFFNMVRATGPKISTLFNGESTINFGFNAIDYSHIHFSPGCGITHCETNLYVVRGSSVWAVNGIFSHGLQQGIFLSRAAKGVVQGCDATHCGVRGLNVRRYALADASLIDVSNCGGVGIRVNRGIVYAQNSIAENCAQSAIFAGQASIVSAENSKLNDAGQNAIFAGGATTIHASDAEIKNAGTHGIDARSGSTVNADGATIEDSFEVGAFARDGARISLRLSSVTGSGTADLRVAFGGIISAHSVTTTNSTGGAPVIADAIGVPEFNVTSDQGVIFAEGDTFPTLQAFTDSRVIRHANGEMEIEASLIAPRTSTRRCQVIYSLPVEFFTTPLIAIPGLRTLTSSTVDPWDISIRIASLTESSITINAEQITSAPNFGTADSCVIHVLIRGRWK